MIEHRFRVEGTPRVALRLPVGEARVVQGTPGEVAVRLEGRGEAVSGFRVEHRGDQVVVEPDRPSSGWRSAVDVIVEVGAAPHLAARLTAASLGVEVACASLEVETASGDVAAAEVEGDVSVRAASAEVRLGRVGGRLDVASASGDVRVERADGTVSAKSASGDLHIDEATADLGAKSASGDVSVTRFSGPWLDVKTMSGDVTVGVPEGRRFDVSFQSLSGEVRTDFPVSSDGRSKGSARLAVKTLSGDIVIQRAG